MWQFLPGLLYEEAGDTFNGNEKTERQTMGNNKSYKFSPIHLSVLPLVMYFFLEICPLIFLIISGKTDIVNICAGK